MSQPAEKISSEKIAFRRSSFRRRLVISQGLVLFAAFLLLGIVGWLSTYAWLHFHAWTLLHREAEEILFHVVAPDGSLDVYRYSWQEPHHIYSEQRVDPYFVQVFNPDGKLIHASANTFMFDAGVYPDHLLEHTPQGDERFQSLRTFHTEDALLYFSVYAIPNPRGDLLGYLQIARYEPGIASTLQSTTIGLTLVLGALLGGLLLLTNWVAGRVVAPLQAITRATNELSPARLSQRISLPKHADQETQRLAVTFNELLGRIETSFKEIKRFTSNAAHELQTPLTVLRGHVDVALRRPRTEASYRETLRLLGEEIDGMSRMVHNLLVLARLDRDQFTARRTPTSITDVVEASIENQQERASRKGLLLEANIAPLIFMEGHAGLLREAVDNVLDNAIKYTDTGSILVTLEALQSGDQAILTVKDTGRGITEEALPHLTNRFYRAEAVQGSGISGSGLGLSIVAQIVEYHHGNLAIDSTLHQGTTVHIRLPIFMIQNSKNMAEVYLENTG